ncbi:hypothetical protein MMC19_003467 [Ptychographa xylographoides]|nr:hypothetical protein [Ptychographa xylographoides]
MAPTSVKKRKLDDTTQRRQSRPTKKFRKQTNYESSSSQSADEIEDIDLITSELDSAVGSPKARKIASEKSASKNAKPQPDLLSDSDSDAESADSDVNSDPSNGSDVGDSKGTGANRAVPKRKDPLAFSTSLSTILSTKLPTHARADPVLSRSTTAKEASQSLVEEKLEARARRLLRQEKKQLTEKGRVRDVVLGDRTVAGAVSGTSKSGEFGTVDQGEGTEQGMSAAEILEQERRLRKTAQRGVVKLFNAVRAAQVKGEEAAREARSTGLVGIERKKERIGELGRNAFLELVAGGGAKA